jgi:hypothetical protein
MIELSVRRSDAGGDRPAAIYSLLGTAKPNGHNPEAFLREVLARIAEHIRSLGSRSYCNGICPRRNQSARRFRCDVRAFNEDLIGSQHEACSPTSRPSLNA